METTETQVSPEASTETVEAQPEMVTDTETTIESPATYADGKFNSVGELEKSYGELQSMTSKKMAEMSETMKAFVGAPEAYEFNEGYVTEGNQAMADMLGAWGQENQMSNDGLNSLVSKYNEYQHTANEATMKAEYEKLGENGGERIKTAREFLEANYGAELTKAAASSFNSAAGIELIEKMIAGTKSPTVAPQQAAPFANKEKIHEMRFAKDEFGVRKMENSEYRNMVIKLEAAIQK